MTILRKHNSSSSNRQAWVLFENSFLRGEIQLLDCDSESNFDLEEEPSIYVYVESLKITIPFPRQDVYYVNPNLEVFDLVRDLTSLQYLHEPGILRVLKGRAYENFPYTFLSGILVSVNPLIQVDEKVSPGSVNINTIPHPFSLAERAFQQLCFSSKTCPSRCAQSIVIAGESGAGKTEVSKRVLQHLIARVVNNKRTSVDSQLLDVNPILESFGNAATLRNHNSSRFGKLIKLHFDCDDVDQVKLVYASINSYLLERSRISIHGPGERSFRVFYELVNGVDDQEFRERAHLDGDRVRFPKHGFRYLTPSTNEEATSTKQYQPDEQMDRSCFKALIKALNSVGLGDTIDRILLTISGVLHLGNIEFIEVESEQGGVAAFHQHTDVSLPSQLMGLDPAKLAQLLCERVVKIGGESLTIKRKLNEAVEARDALAKSVYSALFDWLLSQINSRFSPNEDVSKYTNSYVGVLDIFGFETFAKNDFEQLLINFANEALHETFHEKVLVAEAQLYREEGILQDEREATIAARGDYKTVVSTSSCLELLMGNKGTGFRGILQILQAESECPKPTDDKFLHVLHTKYETHDKFPAPHPKDKRNTFIITHYAADVVYTIGNFMKKNLDRLPKDAQDVLSTDCNDDFIQQLLATTTQKHTTKRQSSIASKFSQQIFSLVQNLDSTQCSFVRCIKPNPSMSRDYNDGIWFDETYVLDQLQCLGVPQTARALRRGGFPTRLDYSQFVANCNVDTQLLDVGLNRSIPEIEHRRNVRLTHAIFWAHEIPDDSFCFGKSKVFFTPGALKSVNELLEQRENLQVTQRRIKSYIARIAWTSCIVKIVVMNRFVKVLEQVRKMNLEKQERAECNAATQIQKLTRWYLCRADFVRKCASAICLQKYWRMARVRLHFRSKLRAIKQHKERKLLQQQIHEHLHAQIQICSEQMQLLKQQVLKKQSFKMKRPLPPPKPNHKRSLIQSTNTTATTEEEEKEDGVAKSTRHSTGGLVLLEQQRRKHQPPPPPPKSRRTLKRQSLTTLHRSSMLLMPSKNIRRHSISSSWHSSKSDSSSSSSSANYKQIRTVFLSLRQSEREYVDALSVINGNYFQPLKARIGLEDHILGKREVDVIFSNLVQLLHLHAQVLTIIENQLAKKEEAYDIMGFLCGFQATLPFIRTIYAVYVKEHSSSLAMLTQCRAEVPKFSKFLKAASENKKLGSFQTDLGEMLRLPLVKVQSYNVFLHTLLSHTSPESQAHEQLTQTCHTIEEMSKELDEEREVARRNIRLYEIATQLEGTTSRTRLTWFATHQDEKLGENQHDILCPGRTFLTEWTAPLSVGDAKPSGRAFFLFSDVFVVAKRSSPQQLTLKLWLDLSKIFVDASHLAPTNKAANGSEINTVNRGAGKRGGDKRFPLQVIYVCQKRVDHLTIWCGSQIQRKDIFLQLSHASRELKKKREQLVHMQKRYAGGGCNNPNQTALKVA